LKKLYEDFILTIFFGVVGWGLLFNFVKFVSFVMPFGRGDTVLSDLLLGLCVLLLVSLVSLFWVCLIRLVARYLDERDGTSV